MPNQASDFRRRKRIEIRPDARDTTANLLIASYSGRSPVTRQRLRDIAPNELRVAHRVSATCAFKLEFADSSHQDSRGTNGAGKDTVELSASPVKRCAGVAHEKVFQFVIHLFSHPHESPRAKIVEDATIAEAIVRLQPHFVADQAEIICWQRRKERREGG